MFTIKKIGIAFSVLALVGLVGGLMAGPAFASKPESAHKTSICHYNGEDVFAAGPDEILGTVDDVLVEAMGWYFRKVDDASVEDHMANHVSERDGGDFLIDDPELGDRSQECKDLVGDTEDLDAIADAEEAAAEEALEALDD